MHLARLAFGWRLALRRRHLNQWHQYEVEDRVSSGGHLIQGIESSLKRFILYTYR